MSMQFRALADQANADGEISAEEVLSLRHEGWENGQIDADEAEAIFALNEHLKHASTEWCEFFVEAMCEYVVNGTHPRGYVSEENAEWLCDRIDRDGKLDSVTELELMVRTLEVATSVPDGMKEYALAQIETAVLTGSGPTRHGGMLSPGPITDAETHLLRRLIFSAGGDRPAAVSAAEAELLFRIKDATLGRANSTDWPELFVQGVGNYLQGFGGDEQLTRERATELEAFMNNAAVNLGRFFANMSKAKLKDGIAFMREGDPEPRDYDAESAAAHEVTASEQAWLQAHLDADGDLDDLEKALVAFLAEAA